MTELAAKAIQQIVEQQFEANPNAVEKSIFAGINSSMTTEEITAKMILNSTHLSVCMAVQITLELLSQTDIVPEFDETQLRKLILSPVKE